MSSSVSERDPDIRAPATQNCEWFNFLVVVSSNLGLLCCFLQETCGRDDYVHLHQKVLDEVLYS